MSAVAILWLIAGALCFGVLVLIPLGFRTGDRDDEAWVPRVEPGASPRGVRLTVSNPGDIPVLVGVSLRRCGLRLRLEGGSYVSIRSRSTVPDVLATGQAAVGVIPAGSSETLWVPADPSVRGRAEVVATVGQHRRLRVIHRLVVLSDPAPASLDRAIPSPAIEVDSPDLLR